MNLTNQPVNQWYSASGMGNGGVAGGQVQYNVGPDKTAFVNMDVVSTLPIATASHADDVPPTASSIRDALQTLTGANRLAASAINGLPPAPTGASVKGLLEGLSGDDRLDASAIKDLPAGGSGGGDVALDVGTYNVAQPWIRIANDVTGISWNTQMVSANIDDLRGKRLVIYNSNANELTQPVRIIFDYQGGTANFEKADTTFTILNLTNEPLSQWYGANGTGDGAVRSGQVQASVASNLQALVTMNVVSGVAIGTVSHIESHPVTSYPPHLTGTYWDIDCSGGETDILIRPKGQGQTFAGAWVIDLQDVLDSTKILRINSTRNQVVNLRIYANAKSWIVGKSMIVENLTKHNINLILGPDLVPGSSALTVNSIARVIDYSRGQYVGFSLDNDGNIVESITQEGTQGGGIGDFASKDWVNDRLSPDTIGNEPFALLDFWNKWLNTGIRVEQDFWYQIELSRLTDPDNPTQPGSTYPLTLFNSGGLWRATAFNTNPNGDVITDADWANGVDGVKFSLPNVVAVGGVARIGVLVFRIFNEATNNRLLCVAFRPEPGTNFNARDVPTHVHLTRMF